MIKSSYICMKITKRGFKLLMKICGLCLYITLWYVQIPFFGVGMCIYLGLFRGTYLYERSTCRYFRLNALNVLSIHRPCLNTTNYYCFFILLFQYQFLNCFWMFLLYEDDNYFVGYVFYVQWGPYYTIVWWHFDTGYIAFILGCPWCPVEYKWNQVFC